MKLANWAAVIFLFRLFSTAYAQSFDGYDFSGWWAGNGSRGRIPGGGSVSYRVGTTTLRCPPCPIPVAGYVTFTNANTGVVTTNTFLTGKASLGYFRAHIDGGGIIVGRSSFPNSFDAGGQIRLKVGRRYLRGHWYAAIVRP